MIDARTVGNVVLVLAAIPAALFVILYAARSRWEDSQIGRQTMALSAVIAGVLVLSVFRLFLADTTRFYVARLAVFAMIVPVLWWRLPLLVKSQRVVYDGDATHSSPGGSMEPEDFWQKPETPLNEMAPVDATETDLPPTGTPPEDWDQEAHVDANAADPAVSIYEDEEEV